MEIINSTTYVELKEKDYYKMLDIYKLAQDKIDIANSLVSTVEARSLSDVEMILDNYLKIFKDPKDLERVTYYIDGSLTISVMNIFILAINQVILTLSEKKADNVIIAISNLKEARAIFKNISYNLDYEPIEKLISVIDLMLDSNLSCLYDTKE